MNYCKISLKPLTGTQVRAGYHNTEFKKLFGNTKVDPNLPFSRSEFFQASRKNVQGMSISGVQQKLSLKESEEHQLIATSQGGEYILKPSPEAYPHAAENEHTAMLVSQLMGIETAKCGLVSFDGGEMAYIARRFDRMKDAGKLHQEDLMQCFNLPSDKKYHKTYEEAGKLVQEVTGGKQAVVLDFIRRVILAYVTGNDDLHLKNFSVQRLPGNTSRYYDKLTPNYDCLFCDAFRLESELPEEGEEAGLGLLALGLLHDREEGDEYFTELFNHYGYYTGHDFLALGLRLDLPEKPIRSFIAKLTDNSDTLIELIDRSYMPTYMKARAAVVMKSRIRAMQTLDAD